MQKITPDTWNQPQPITVDDQVFMMKELTALSLKAHLRDFFAISGRVAGKKELADMMSGTAQQKEAIYAEIFAGTMEGYADEVFAVLAESTELDMEVIRKMPASLMLGLLDGFMQLHDKSIKRFFGVRRRWSAAVEEWNEAPATAPPNSSRALSEADSPTPSAVN